MRSVSVECRCKRAFFVRFQIVLSLSYFDFTSLPRCFRGFGMNFHSADSDSCAARGGICLSDAVFGLMLFGWLLVSLAHLSFLLLVRCCCLSVDHIR